MVMCLSTVNQRRFLCVLIGLFVSQSGISFKKLGSPTAIGLWRGSHSTPSLNWGLSSSPNLGEVHGCCWVVAVVVAVAAGG